MYQKHDGKILPDVLGDGPQKVVVGLVDTQSPLLLKSELEVEKKESEGGDLDTWSPAVTLISPNLKALVFSFLFCSFL